MANSRQTKNKRVSQNMVDASRQEQNTKRKKTNLILNILIIVVALLIVLSLWFVLFTTNKKEQTPSNTKTASSVKNKEDAAGVSKKEKTPAKEEKAKEETKTEKSDDPNVSEVITKNWQAVKTEQTGQHINSYDSSSVDWKEKLEAASEGADIPRDDMSVWFVEHGEKPATEAITTVSKKEMPDKAFRVYLSWKDNEGWAATKVEVLKTNDKR